MKNMEENNFIHPTSIVEDNVILGKNNYIGPFCLIKSGTIIGDNNRFEAYVSIGTNPEHKEFFTGSDYSVTINNNNTFREFVTVNSGSVKDTLIGNNCILLRNSHVGHDCILEDGVTLSCNVLVGGHSLIKQGVNMGLGSICHQYSILGDYSMIGMGGIVTKSSNIKPGFIYVGNPCKVLKVNEIGLKRNNIDVNKWEMLSKKYEELCLK
jgi:UDP-N-acetylglucosamine acyltransferase